MLWKTKFILKSTPNGVTWNVIVTLFQRCDSVKQQKTRTMCFWPVVGHTIVESKDQKRPLVNIYNGFIQVSIPYHRNLFRNGSWNLLPLVSHRVTNQDLSSLSINPIQTNKKVRLVSTSSAECKPVEPQASQQNLDEEQERQAKPKVH